MKMSALLVAMSVGASIVIADDEEPLRANIHDHQNQSKKTASMMRRFRVQAKNFALRTFEFGKEITYKTVNVTVYISDRIGVTIASLIK